MSFSSSEVIPPPWVCCLDWIRTYLCNLEWKKSYSKVLCQKGMVFWNVIPLLQGCALLPKKGWLDCPKSYLCNLDIYIMSMTKIKLLNSFMWKRLGFLKCHATPPRSCPIPEWCWLWLRTYLCNLDILIMSMSKNIVLKMYKCIMPKRLGFLKCHSLLQGHAPSLSGLTWLA